MNILHGKITEIQTSGSVSIVSIDVQGSQVTSIVLENPESSSYIKTGAIVQVLFKETEVVVGTGEYKNLSLQNKFRGTILSLNKGVILSTLEVATNVGIISSMITTNAVNQLHLVINTTVTVMIKSNEIMLSK